MKILLLLTSLFIYATSVNAYENNNPINANDCTQCHVKPSLVVKGNKLNGQLAYIKNRCTDCHGAKGVTTNPANVPSLAGQKKGYLVSALSSYKNCQKAGDNCNPTEYANQRKDITMEYYASTLKNQNIADIAAYLEDQSYSLYCKNQTAPIKKESKKLYIRYCSNCHGGRGLSQTESYPNLAYQTKSYLQKAIAYYKPEQTNPSRNSYHMTEGYENVPKQNIEAILNYLTSITRTCQKN